MVIPWTNGFNEVKQTHEIDLPQKDMKTEKKTVLSLSKRYMILEWKHVSFSSQKSQNLSQAGHIFTVSFRQIS
jgi:hypothetical protein